MIVNNGEQNCTLKTKVNFLRPILVFKYEIENTYIVTCLKMIFHWIPIRLKNDLFWSQISREPNKMTLIAGKSINRIEFLFKRYKQTFIDEKVQNHWSTLEQYLPQRFSIFLRLLICAFLWSKELTNNTIVKFQLNSYKYKYVRIQYVLKIIIF